MLKIKILSIVSCIVFFTMGIRPSFAQETITFGPRETRIEGSIPYSVIGKYKAHFRAFKGKIVVDQGSRHVQSVYLEIKVNSIASNCPWCDRIARSRRLLNAARYPRIIFKSDQIVHDGKGFRVKGILEMHGIKRVLAFPFDVAVINDVKRHRKMLVLHGSWAIDRKDFNIVWSKYLDHGGVIVGNYLTVNWGIKTDIK